ncbi:hypothetical protein A0J48_002525 [Sphaerospermopsis aphanizomenoides BCCUSP55]|uniref:hypothetical protein n=1 Tax=Sphaerospermopsis aphanizomenoides TaxID=459663 RepID=UPI00190390E5|nr:hypothetical protein [Sphaerospermopsis aphanizomenoides]MBK1986436.1 hypothetical protein [Sphaerospermopsis aphanizomenoides BCCUSP55]
MSIGENDESPIRYSLFSPLKNNIFNKPYLDIEGRQRSKVVADKAYIPQTRLIKWLLIAIACVA